MLGRLLDWFGDHRFAVLAASFLCVGGTWCFIEIADEVFKGKTQSFDDRMILAMRHAEEPAVPIGPKWLEEVGRDLTALGGVVVLAIVTFAVAGFMALSGKYREMCLLLAATFGGVIIVTIFKYSFDRPRPDLVSQLSYVVTSSFPSGHSMMSAVVYLTLGTVVAEMAIRKRLKFYCLAVAMTIVLLVGVSRVYVGVHYPTDVLAGWSAGLVWAMICWLIARLLRRKGGVEPQPSGS